MEAFGLGSSLRTFFKRVVKKVDGGVGGVPNGPFIET